MTQSQEKEVHSGNRVVHPSWNLYITMCVEAEGWSIHRWSWRSRKVPDPTKSWNTCNRIWVISRAVENHWLFLSRGIMIIFESQKAHSDHGVKNEFMDVGKLEVGCPAWEDVIILRRGNCSLGKKSRNEDRKKWIWEVFPREHTRDYNCCSGCGKKWRWR